MPGCCAVSLIRLFLDDPLRRPTCNAKAPTWRKSPTLKPKLMLRHALGRVAMALQTQDIISPIVAKFT